MPETKKWPWDKGSSDSGLIAAGGSHSLTEPQIFKYCRALGVSPKVSPGLDPGGPTIDGDGDGRYAVGPELGRGGGGVVYLGTDRSLRRSLALKVLSPDLVTDPTRVQAFVEEAIITGGLEHPNIVPAYDLGCSSALGIYYTMKRLTGRPLADVLSSLRSGDPATLQSFGLYRLLGCFVELCRAVAYAHARGVLHCDLKPENVFIGEYGEVVLVDWGLAQVLGPDGRRQARALMRAGTPEYMAPEQITRSSQDLDVRSDIWSLGVILYELLTLTLPFQGANAREVLMRVMVEQVEPPSERTPGRTIPPGVEDICRRALSKNRDFRYASVGDLLAELEAELEAAEADPKVRAIVMTGAGDRAFGETAAAVSARALAFLRIALAVTDVVLGIAALEGVDESGAFPGDDLRVEALRSQIEAQGRARVIDTLAEIGADLRIPRRQFVGHDRRLDDAELGETSVRQGQGQGQAAVRRSHRTFRRCLRQLRLQLCAIKAQANGLGRHDLTLHRGARDGGYVDPLPEAIRRAVGSEAGACGAGEEDHGDAAPDGGVQAERSHGFSLSER